MPKFTLKRSDMLKKRDDFTALYKEGKRIRQDAYTLTFRRVDSDNEPAVKVAFVAPKRYMKKAVQRIRTKRLLREAYRLQNQELLKHIKAKTGVVHLLIGYNGNTSPDFNETQMKISLLLSRLLNALKHPKHEN